MSVIFLKLRKEKIKNTNNEKNIIKKKKNRKKKKGCESNLQVWSTFVQTEAQYDVRNVWLGD